jgi:hypothetical protein
MSDADLNFYFDPVCPFAWMTSKWVRMVAEQRAYRVDWRFISLRMINADIDYDAHFPPGYQAGHTAGLRLLRVAARARTLYGRPAVGALYAAMGARIFDATTDDDPMTGPDRGSRAFLEPILGEVGLPPELSEALEDTTMDAELRAETDEALTLTGKDVGTPILHFRPPTGVAFFGAGDQPPPDSRTGRPALGQRAGVGQFPGFRRAQAQSAGTAPARQLRCRR